jgi:hypothetical protein
MTFCANPTPRSELPPPVPLKDLPEIERDEAHMVRVTHPRDPAALPVVRRYDASADSNALGERVPRVRWRSLMSGPTKKSKCRYVPELSSVESSETSQVDSMASSDVGMCMLPGLVTSPVVPEEDIAWSNKVSKETGRKKHPVPPAAAVLAANVPRDT